MKVSETQIEHGGSSPTLVAKTEKQQSKFLQPLGPKTSNRIFHYYLFLITVSLTIHTSPTLRSRESPDAVGLSLGVYHMSGFLPSLRILACRTMGLTCFASIDVKTSSWLIPFSDDIMSAASKPCHQLVKHVSMLP